MSGVDGGFSTLMTVLAGSVMTVLGAVLANGPQPYSEGEVVAARVVAVDQDPSAGRAQYFPVVEFEVDGTVHHVIAHRGSVFAPTVGSTIEVSYPSGRPDLARSLYQPRSMTVLALGVVGAGAMIIAAGAMVWRRRFRRSGLDRRSTVG